MIIKKDTCKLALVQAAPVMFDRDKCVEKIIQSDQGGGR